ncbi:mitochondrial glutathione transporter SLC25A40-like [Watersipora subatra]|uniref:mitochondrial glutathione transporter SLC25A40-like n=1 Tax=Watersipora subatra TaxID=2589382 RepID=UPI00355B322A
MMSEIFQQMIASCSGALLTSIFITPLDVVKIRLQAQTKGFVKGECFLYCNGLMDHVCTCLNGGPSVGSQAKLWRQLPNEQLNGMLDALIKIPKVEGVTSLWSGLYPTLIMAVPNTIVYFTTYDQVKKRLGYVDGMDNSKYIPALSGASARAVAITVISPLELIRTKIQSEKMTYKETTEAIRASIKLSGIRSLWTGWSALMWRDVPFSALYFTLYESMKSASMSRSSTSFVPTWQSFLFGAVSGSICATVTLPFDVIKTHRQIELGSKIDLKSAPSTYSMMSSLYKQQGVAALFSGFGPRVLKVAPACAIMISSYEYCKRLFAKPQPRDFSTGGNT